MKLLSAAKRDILEQGLNSICDSYETGVSYNRVELLTEVRERVAALLVQVGAKSDTPLYVNIDDGILRVRVGRSSLGV